MPDSSAPASEVRLTNGQALEVTESVDAILAQRPESLAGIAFVRLTQEDGRPVYVAAGHIVMVRPRASAAGGA